MPYIRLPNAKVTHSSTDEIIESISNLIDYCNTKFLKDFPVDLVYKPGNTYRIDQSKIGISPDLNPSNLPMHRWNTRNYIADTSMMLDLYRRLNPYGTTAKKIG